MPGWIGRRSTRTLLLAGAVTIALAGVGGAASLLAGRGEVGGPPTLLGAVSPRARRVTLAHGCGDRRVAEAVRIVRVADPQVLGAIGVRRPFALWIGEVTEYNPTARAVAYGSGGAKLGAVGIPNGGAGSAGFLPRQCELPRIEDFETIDATILLPAPVRTGFAAFSRPQRADDRPAWLVRRLLGRGRGRNNRYATPLLMESRGEIDLDALRRTGTAPDGRPLFLVVTRSQPPRLPGNCLRTTTPRLRREEARQERARLRASRAVSVMLVDSRLMVYGAVQDDAIRSRGYGARGLVLNG